MTSNATGSQPTPTTTSGLAPNTQAWLDQVDEPVIDPELPIVDPHHHLWPVGGALPYGLAELHFDARGTQPGSGVPRPAHNVVQTVFIECSAAYRTEGPKEFAPVGETEFVAAQAASDPGHLISGIVARADLRLDNLDDVLDAHEQAAQGLMRGIRHALARAEVEGLLRIPGRAPKDMYLDPAFRTGVKRLGERGFTYDSWHYHYQNHEFLGLARAVPTTTMILDHFGTPLGVGPYAAQADEIFAQWKLDIAEIAKCENVVAKLGGLAMPDNGFTWHDGKRPPTSDELLESQKHYYMHAIEAFGPERCMFESNFPIDRMSLSYNVYWNACKKLTSRFTSSERAAMFSGTARRVYRL